MNSVLLLSFFALFSVILLKLTEDFSPKFKGFFLCGASCLFFIMFIKQVSPAFHFLTKITQASGFSSLFQLLLKALGIALLVSISASFCRDLGEEGVASKLELCGKGAILSLSLPVLQEILKFVGEMTS